MGCSISGSAQVSNSTTSIKRIQNKKVIKQLSWDKLSNQQEQTIASIENIEFFYEFKQLLGKGQFGQVFLAKRRKEPQDEVAIKVLNLHQFDKFPLEYIKREVQISKTLDHPNIIKFQETYIDKKSIYIVMEYCVGGSLMQKSFSEQEVLNIMKKLFYAVNYMHQRDIIHRDLKLENILYESNKPDAEIKIIDFGLSKKVPQQQKARRHSIVGSGTYMAPEVISNKNYDKSCDVWSLGVIMYRLLCGEMPFVQKKQIIDGTLFFKNPIWSSISRDAFDLLKKMINVYPQYRITIDKALKHSWFQQRRSTVLISQLVKLQPSNLDVLDRCSFYTFFTQFKKEILQMYAKRHVSKEQELIYRKLFKSIDSENKGFMTRHELDSAMEKVGIQIQNADNHSSPQKSFGDLGTIEYSEFLSACAGQDLITNQKELKAVFDLIDADCKDKITQTDIEVALQREGRKLSKEKLQHLIEEIDTYFDDQQNMTFDSFCACIGYQSQEKKISKFAQQNQISESDEEMSESNSSNSDEDNTKKQQIQGSIQIIENK